MATVDLIIKNGEVWTPGGIIKTDLAIHRGKIAALGNSDIFFDTKSSIDASGKTIIPGLIDTHTHHRDPGFTHKEDLFTATQAAAAGGVTLSVGMPNVNPPTTTLARYNRIVKDGMRKAVVHFNHNPAPTNLKEVPKLAKSGALAFKLFMIRDTRRSYPHMPGIGVSHQGELLKIFEAVAGTGLPLMVHPHSQEIMDVVERGYWKRGLRGPTAYADAYRAHKGIVWDSAIATLLRMQETTGAKLHVLHVNTLGAVELIRRAKDKGQDVTAEVNPWALFLGHKRENLTKLGPYALGIWLPEEDSLAMWDAINDGTIDICGTDHAPHTSAEKEIGWKDMWEAPGGAPVIQEYLSLFLTEMDRGRISLDRLVRLTSHNPAQRFALAPKKGTIQIGADADLAIVDLKQEKTILSEEMYSKCGWTPYAGQKVIGVPTMTLVKGKIVMQDGKITGQPGDGEWAKRGK
jgi:dihydroorotase